jgi:hypothetical protein
LIIFNAGVAYGLTASSKEFVETVRREGKWTRPAWEIIERHAAQAAQE